MDETNVMAYFCIYADDFDLDEVTSLMKLTPTRVAKKGVIATTSKIPAINTRWEISTEYECSYDISFQLNKILNLLKDKKEVLKEIKQRFQVNFLFELVIMIENKETLGINFDEETLNFISEIGATIDIDTYVNS